MNSKSSQSISPFSIYLDSQDSPSRLQNSQYLNTLPRACDTQLRQLQPRANDNFSSPINKHKISSIYQPINYDIEDDSAQLMDKKNVTLASHAQFSGNKIHDHQTMNSVNDRKNQGMHVFAKEKRKPLRDLKLNQVLLQRQKRKVIDKLKLALNLSNRNCGIKKSVGQMISVKSPAIIKERKQKKLSLENNNSIFDKKKKQSSVNSGILCREKKLRQNKEAQPNISGQSQKSPKKIIQKNSKVVNASRKRKSPFQVEILRHQFQIQPNWTKPILEKISKFTGLSVPQVYKWGWDQGRNEGVQRIQDQSLHKLYSEKSDEDDDADDDDDDDDDGADVDNNDDDEKDDQLVGLEDFLKFEDKDNEQQSKKQQNICKKTRRKSSRLKQPQREKSRKNYKLPITDQFGGYAKRHYSNEFLQFDQEFQDKFLHQLAKQNVVLSPNGQMGELRIRVVNSHKKSDKQQQDYNDQDEKNDDNTQRSLKKRATKNRKISNELTTDILSSGYPQNIECSKKQKKREDVKSDHKNKIKKSPPTSSQSKKSNKIKFKRATALTNSQKKSKRQNKKKSICLKIQSQKIRLQASLSISEVQQGMAKKRNSKKVEQLQNENFKLSPSSSSSLQSSQYQSSPHLYSFDQPPPVPYACQHCSICTPYISNQNPMFHHYHNHHHLSQLISHQMIFPQNRSSSDDNENQNINDNEQQQQTNRNLFEQQNSNHFTPRSHHSNYNYNDQNDFQHEFPHQSPYGSRQQFTNYQDNINNCTGNDFESNPRYFLTPQFHHHNSAQIDLLNPAENQQRQAKLKQISQVRRVSRVTNIANSVPNSISLNYCPISSPPHRQSSAPDDLFCNNFEVSSFFGQKEGDKVNDKDYQNLYKNIQLWNDTQHNNDDNHRTINILDNQDKEHYFISSPDLSAIHKRQANRRRDSKFSQYSATKRDFKVNGFLEKEEGDHDYDYRICQKQIILDYGKAEEEEDEDEEQKKEIDP